MNGDGEFRVKDVRNLLDETFLPKSDSHTRWIMSIPIKINIFAWKVSLDRLPTRSNLVRRGVLVSSDSCPIGCACATPRLGDHLLFRACYSWFKSIRCLLVLKEVLERCVLHYVVEAFGISKSSFVRAKKPRKEVLFVI
ncbi:Lipase, GDSL [Artemisia annua]|uniref:Lipase, GDSL n=1 Tax=Artemisia annua TaxID=35608 RepID=A0A2U1MUD4_ARTAN|nr:Lipase, GDSL [Artemisia annua]